MAASSLQAAAGIQGGAEAAIHAMKDIFEEVNTEAVILVDASNACVQQSEPKNSFTQHANHLPRLSYKHIWRINSNVNAGRS